MPRRFALPVGRSAVAERLPSADQGDREIRHFASALQCRHDETVRPIATQATRREKTERVDGSAGILHSRKYLLRTGATQPSAPNDIPRAPHRQRSLLVAPHDEFQLKLVTQRSC